MKLYYSPGACSLASRIALHELGREALFEKVDLRAKQTESGRDFREVNPLGYVPALELDDGRIVTENVAILPYIADLAPGELAPEPGSPQRVDLLQTLGFLSGELHKAFSPFFGSLEGAARESAVAKLESRVDHVERLLGDGREFLLGSRYTVADAYAFVILSWSRMAQLSLARWPHVVALVERVGSRPAVRTALAEEGLTETAG